MKYIDLNFDDIVHKYSISADPPKEKLARILKDHGCSVSIMNLSWNDLLQISAALPAIALLKDGGAVVVTALAVDDLSAPIATEEVKIQIWDPCAAPEEAQDGKLIVSKAVFERRWSGALLLFKKRHSILDKNQPFGLRWFIPEILRYKAVFSEIALAAFFIYVISLLVPIFFQVVIDKILIHEARNTLVVLGIGVTLGLIFEWLIKYIQKYYLLYATSKIDIRVGVRSFAKLLRLPIDFFEGSTAGVITKNLQQTAAIREFLTGQLFMTLLDSLSLFVFIPAIFYYSWKLAILVLGMTALVSLIMLVIIPVYRKKIEELYDAEGRLQSILFETVKGIHTVKSSTLEPVRRKLWDEALSSVVNRQFEVGKTATLAYVLTGFIERLMTVIIIWYGAHLVFSGEITVGALVAFNMLAARVIGPLVQMATLVHRFQEARLSISRLGHIMNHQDERGMISHLKIPDQFDNSIVFENVTFTYPAAGGVFITRTSPVLKDINIDIPANERGWIIGIVGRSGSGKTTLTKLMQGFYVPDRGIVRVGGHDLKELDVAALRRNIGVVLQESFLFRGTILENIMMRRPQASRAEVEEAARLAGAHEFIEKLPHGYATFLEEGGTNLSGGQRQRLSIARALLANPRFMIFDEATSSLDPLTEKIFRNNIRRISAGRTVFVVSHRLSTIRDSDMIIVIDEGRIESFGKHDELLANSPIYRELWAEQSA